VENVAQDPAMLRRVVERNLLEGDPFVLVDVGCGLGIDPAWRLFGDQLHAYGVDPQVEEIARLAASETNPNVHYDAAFVALPDDHPFARQRRVDDAAAGSYFDWFGRTSAWAAVSRAAAEPDASFKDTNNWDRRRLADEKIELGGYLHRRGIHTVDFVKVDTDGGDLEILVSGEDEFEAKGILGFMVEAFFTGSHHDTAPSFHNIDGLMRKHGYTLCDISVERYSRAALPATFKYPIFAQTTAGQPLWGDVVYLLDGAHPDLGSVWHGALTPAKLLKLACLYELFRLPDCAAELVEARRAELGRVADPDELLDALTPPLHGRRVGYRDYVSAFARDPAQFFPGPAPTWRGRLGGRGH
jgi:Methyltransferase FkbM domain